MRRVAIRIVSILFLLVSCTSPADRKLTQENLAELQKSNALTGEEYQLLQAFVMRTGLSSVLSGKDSSEWLDSSLTIRQAIAAQRQWIIDDSIATAKAKAEAAEALRKYEQEVAQLRSIITVTPVRKTFAEQDYSSYIRFQMVVRNSGTKPVRAFKGYVRVTDLFGDLISRLEVKDDDGLVAGKDRVIAMLYSYNQFIDRDVTLRHTDIDKMKFEWEPEVILFADGTELIVPERPDR